MYRLSRNPGGGDNKEEAESQSQQDHRGGGGRLQAVRHQGLLCHNLRLITEKALSIGQS